MGFVPRPPDHFIVLTDEQVEVARRLLSADYGVLDGATGSGKTHIAALIAIALAERKRRVLVLTPRRPLAMWLHQTLRPHGVQVQTVHACAQAALAAKWTVPPQRRRFDDPEFFGAASEAVLPGEYDLVIGDEWQTTTAAEQDFVSRVVGSRSFLQVQDSSRDLREAPSPPPPVESAENVTLTLSQRAFGPAPLVDPDPPGSPSGSRPGDAPSVAVTPVDGPDDLEIRVLEALALLRARGFSEGEIGVVSLLGRAQSVLVTTLSAPAAQVRAFQLHEVPALKGLACDSFSYWLGLERRAVVIVEAPLELKARETRLHIAVSRACDLVHFVLPREVLGDHVLNGSVQPEAGPSPQPASVPASSHELPARASSPRARRGAWRKRFRE